MSERYVKFECRKCEHQLFLTIPNDFTVSQVLEKLNNLKYTECPNCGEEPYRLWMFESVCDSLPDDVRWIKNE